VSCSIWNGGTAPVSVIGGTKEDSNSIVRDGVRCKLQARRLETAGRVAASASLSGDRTPPGATLHAAYCSSETLRLNVLHRRRCRTFSPIEHVIFDRLCAISIAIELDGSLPPQMTQARSGRERPTRPPSKLPLCDHRQEKEWCIVGSFAAANWNVATLARLRSAELFGSRRSCRRSCSSPASSCASCFDRCLVSIR
jgi:hypothetical protein